MVAAGEISGTQRGVRIRPVALPVEHGGWALLFEPIVLGILLAPSWPGALVSLAAIGGFLARHPFKLAAIDWRRRGRTTRTSIAELFSLTYFVVAAASLAASIKLGGTALLIPLGLAFPFAIVQLYYDATGRSRALIAELAGSISMGAVATAIAVAGGWSRSMAFVLWVLIAARNVPTILYLRARLRLLHRKPASMSPVVVAHLVAILAGIGLAGARMAPSLAVGALMILFLRAVLGFSESGKLVTAKKLGVGELGFGAMTVFAIFMGYIAGW